MLPNKLVLDGLLAALTFASYSLACALFLRSRHPLTQPVFLGAALIILVLTFCRLDYEIYRPVQNLLAWPLGPATVALAVPVYKQRSRLRSAGLSLACGVGAGCLTTMTAVLSFAFLGRLPNEVLGALAVKSVTAPIAVELARLHGYDPSLTAVFVVATGMLGAIFGPLALSRFEITDPVARGVALGTTSHGQGTAIALLESETTGAMASLAMIGAAIFTSVIAPVYVPWLLSSFAR